VIINAGLIILGGFLAWLNFLVMVNTEDRAVKVCGGLGMCFAIYGIIGISLQ